MIPTHKGPIRLAMKQSTFGRSLCGNDHSEFLYSTINATRKYVYMRDA